ncbi:DUF2189 domain-containing protein [uncultured Maritimibacter sp.]|jgi:uncharacterized membrane protein|uniref:DUF2189 domain-containing protein n=1 Tax=uncultured Maritimibacter sp. TaxID=991866 RepID=UPI002607B4E8|nr:DUF2189 domain-containing protein [uncultured Maritimibacter sp.]
MDAGQPPVAAPMPKIGPVTYSDIPEILSLGARDFLRAPGLGLAFGAFYAMGGLILLWQFEAMDQSYLVIPVAFGFPLLGPFVATGLYEMSRRLEYDLPFRPGDILGVIFRQKDRQIPSMAVVVIMIFLFWVFLAHMIFALFLGLMPMTNILTDWQATILAPEGLRMLGFGTLVGAGFAFVLYALTVVSLPLLLDKEIDFITAMIVSFQLVMVNTGPMLVWGAVIAVLLFLAMLPFFVGLVLVLPILGHASWHLYRRALIHPDA